MQFINVLVAALAIPVALLNMFGGIASGIWLAILGEWWAIGWGIGILFVGAFLASLLLMPSILLIAPAAALADRGHRRLSTLLGVAAGLYTMVVVGGWCLGVFWLFLSRSTDENLAPLLLWSYGSATAVWSFLANKERQGGGGNTSTITTMFASFGCLSWLLMIYFGRPTWEELALVMAAFLVVPLAISSLLLTQVQRTARY